MSRSFFTAIYLNGAPVSSSQESCSNIGQPNYCCASGQSCAWDDGGKVACCASGMSCQGAAYSSGAYNQGAGAGAGGYYASSTSSWHPQQQTTTVYQSQGENCNCETTTNYGNVVPIVPITAATVLTSYIPTTTSYYNPPTSTYYASTTPAVAAVITTNAACPGGYTTVTEANVGAPVRTVGCNVIIDSGANRKTGAIRDGTIILWLSSVWGMAMLVG